MSVGSSYGSNAMGHRGWVILRCRICGRILDVTREEAYYCPKCGEEYGAYFCSPDSKTLHYKCPFCNGAINPL